MPLKRLYLNDTDLSTYGMWAALPLGWGDAPSLTDTVTRVPGHAGGMLLVSDSDVAVREVVVEGIMHAPAGDLRAQWDKVKKILASPVVELRFEDWPDLYGLARYKTGEMRPLPGLTPNYGCGFLLRFVLANPYLLSRTVDIYTCNRGSRVDIALGTAPSPVTLYMVGDNVVNPAVAYLDSQGIQRGRIAFSLTDAAGVAMTLPFLDWIEFDGETLGMLWHQSTGAVNAADFYDPTSVLFVLDPQDGDGVSGPTLVASTCRLIAHVRRAWL